MTHAYENITFLQLLLRAVKTRSQDKLGWRHCYTTVGGSCTKVYDGTDLNCQGTTSNVFSLRFLAPFSLVKRLPFSVQNYAKCNVKT